MSANSSPQAIDRGVSQEVCDLLYLCGRALSGESADVARVQRMNLARVHALAASQGLSALAWYGLESVMGVSDGTSDATGSDAPSGVALAGPLIDTWRAERDKSVRRQMLFENERAQILTWMRDNGIWYVPHKAAVLVGWYPRVGMREFCDNDILYDVSRREDLVQFFMQRGYSVNAVAEFDGKHDSFTKKPVFHFEMHWRLFSQRSFPLIARYFDTVADRLVSADGSPYNLRLTNEDAYLYLIAHVYKHHAWSGTGVRILCDLQVFRSHEDENLDRDYVERVLDELEIGEFGRSLERLAARVFERDFDPAGLCDEDAETLRLLTSYGTYGTVDRMADLRLEREAGKDGSTKDYVAKRIFPDDDWWESFFPFGLKHKWVRGPYLLFRIARAAVEPKRRQRLAADLRAIIRNVTGGRFF